MKKTIAHSTTERIMAFLCDSESPTFATLHENCKVQLLVYFYHTLAAPTHVAIRSCLLTGQMPSQPQPEPCTPIVAADSFSWRIIIINNNNNNKNVIITY